MKELSEIVDLYLRENGLKKDFFADYIGCDCATYTRWIKGERKLTTEQLKKTHEFLSGSHLKSIDEII